MRTRVTWSLAATCLFHAHLAAAQGMTGALIGTVKDAQGGCSVLAAVAEGDADIFRLDGLLPIGRN